MPNLQKKSDSPVQNQKVRDLMYDYSLNKHDLKDRFYFASTEEINELHRKIEQEIIDTLEPKLEDFYPKDTYGSNIYPDAIDEAIQKIYLKHFVKFDKRSDLEKNFEPQNGDLLFGLSDTINRYLVTITANETDLHAKNAERFNWYLTAIEKGINQLLSLKETEPLNLIESWLHFYKMAIYGNYNQVSIAQQIRYEKFLDAIKFSKYNPLQAKEIINSEKLLREGSKLSEHEQRVLYSMRLSCKFAIDDLEKFANSSDSLRKPIIHYLLDGINLDDVLSKKTVNQNSDRGYFLPLITTEIQHIFKYRDKLKNNVIFYQNGMQTLAPWEEEPAKWVPQSITTLPTSAVTDAITHLKDSLYNREHTPPRHPSSAVTSVFTSPSKT